MVAVARSTDGLTMSRAWVARVSRSIFETVVVKEVDMMKKGLRRPNEMWSNLLGVIGSAHDFLRVGNAGA